MGPVGALREIEPHYNALHSLVALAQEAVQRYGGTLQPVVGEQLTAIFGVSRFTALPPEIIQPNGA